MKKEVYITDSGLFRIAYGLELALIQKLETGQPLSKDLMNNLSYHADVRRSLEPERVLGAYRNQNGTFAVMTEDGFSQFDLANARKFNRDVLKTYTSECGESDKVVVTEDRELSELVEAFVKDLDLNPVRF